MNCDTSYRWRFASGSPRRVGGLVAPPLEYGYKSQPKSGGGNHFPGTTSLDAETLIEMTRDVIREFARHGVRQLAIVVGHTENLMFTTEACDLALRDLRAAGIADMKLMHMGYWEFSTEDTLRKVFPDGFPSWNLEHAGVMETSVMLYLQPELVHFADGADSSAGGVPALRRLPGRAGSHSRDRARCPRARSASAEKGKYMLDEYVETISACLAREFRLSRAGAARRRRGGLT